MSNGINQELDFEKRISNMPDRQLLEFVARQNYETCLRCEVHEKRLSSLETGNQKSSSIVGGIAGTITAVIISIANYFVGSK